LERHLISRDITKLMYKAHYFRIIVSDFDACEAC